MYVVKEANPPRKLVPLSAMQPQAPIRALSNLSWRDQKCPISHVSLKCRHIVVRLPSPCRSCNIKTSKSHHQISYHDLSTNSTSFSVGLNLGIISFARAAF